MGQIFNDELNKAEKLSKYNKQRASRVLDDMATAYLSTEFNGLDKSLIAVKTAKKALRAQGYSQEVIDDYMLQRSYLSKTNLRHLMNDSIYTDDSVMVKPIIELRVASHNDCTTTDLIIDRIKSTPVLLSALQRGVSKVYLSRDLGVSSPVLLQHFYSQYKEFIDN